MNRKRVIESGGIRDIVFEPDISIWEIERLVREAFVDAFGAEIVRRVHADKYPDEYGVTVVVTHKDVDQMYDLSSELEDQFLEKGIPVGIAVSTS